MDLQRQRREPVELSLRIQVDALAMQKLWAWTAMAKGEVSCLGLVDQIYDGAGRLSVLRVTDFFLVKQVCTDTETDMEPAAVAQLLMELEQKGVDSSRLRCWAHSHSVMNVFWSGTDHETISGLANGEWLLSLVVNKKRDAMMRLDQYHPCNLWVNDVLWEVYYPQSESLEEACAEDFKAKVTEGFPVLRMPRRNREIIEEVRDARERGIISDEDVAEEMSMLTYGELDYEDDIQPF